MSDTKLQLKAKDPSGTATNLNVTNVNPNASEANMLTFTQSLNALTKNTYVQTNKIVTTPLDTENDQRQTPTIEIRKSGQTQNPSFAFDSLPTTITSQGNQLIYTNSTGKVSITYVADGIVAGNSTDYGFVIGKITYAEFPATAVGVVVHVDGDDTYKPADLQITVTV